jgi:2-dehydro-3-deoxygluconokinase
MRRVLCVGECLLELTHGHANTLRLDFAGDTYNTAVYLRRVATELALRVEVGYLTGLGSDQYSEAMRATWRAEGIVDRSVTVPGGLPGIYTVRTSAAGERYFSYWREQSAARRLFAETEWCKRLQGDVIHLSGITLQLMSAQARDALITRLRELQSEGTRVSFDTNYRAAGWSSPREAATAITRLSSVADMVFTSSQDEQSLADAPSPQHSLRRLARSGVQEAIVRDGARGAYLGQADWVWVLLMILIAPSRVVIRSQPVAGGSTGESSAGVAGGRCSRARLRAAFSQPGRAAVGPAAPARSSGALPPRAAPAAPCRWWLGRASPPPARRPSRRSPMPG